MNKLYNTFENQLRDRMSGHELPYDPRHWNELQASLKPKGKSLSALLVALLATASFLGGGGYVGFVAFNAPSTAKLASNQDLGLSGPIALSKQRLNNVGTTLTTDAASSAYSNLQTDGTNAQSTGSGLEVTPWSNNMQTDSQNNDAAQAEQLVESIGSAANTTPQKKEFSFAPSVSMACAGTAVEFNVTSLPDGVTGNYIWNFGDGKFKAERSPSNVYTKPGQYDVSLSITDDNGRITTTVLNKAIIIVPTPKADFTWHFDNVDPEKPHVTIDNNSQNASSSEWTTKDGNSVKDMNPSFDLNSQGKQMIALQVINQNGCSNGTVKHISVNSDVNLGAPSSMKASKETFLPEALKSNKYNFIMTIYDQNNQVVFETANRKGWDGSMSDGSRVAAGQAYKWKVILINDLTKEEKYFNGTLNIIP